MRARNRIIFSIIMVLLSGQYAFSQFGFYSPLQESQPLFFHVTVFPALSPDTSQLLIFVKIENSALQFVKAGNYFKAGYELTLSVEKEDNILVSQIKRGSVKVTEFTGTQSENLFQYEFFRTFLRHGSYFLRIQLYDLETRKSVMKKQELVVPDYHTRSLVISDIVFLNEINGTLENLRPVMPPVRTEEDTAFCARIDLFSSEPSVTLFETIRNQEKTLVLDTVQIDLPQKRRIVYFRLNQDFPFGKYILSIHAVTGRAEETVRARFYIQAQNHPDTLPDLETAVAALVYIMEKKQWNQLRNAPETEQKKILKTFWKNRDPDPENEPNALEAEYYRRVTVANHEFPAFKNSRQGWKTDRGRIYILYGAPTDIERPLIRPSAEGRFEIWVYHQLQRRFVFFDKYTDGDYRLISQE